MKSTYRTPLSAKRRQTARKGAYATGHWSAHEDGTLPEGAADYIVNETDIRFMWDYGVTVPLWDDEGLLPEDSARLHLALGLSDELIKALTAWGTGMCRVDDRPWDRELTQKQWELAYADLNARAQNLVERLRRELSPRFTVTYIPW